jgi:hypothetical protein
MCHSLTVKGGMSKNLIKGPTLKNRRGDYESDEQVMEDSYCRVVTC